MYDQLCEFERFEFFRVNEIERHINTVIITINIIILYSNQISQVLVLLHNFLLMTNDVGFCFR